MDILAQLRRPDAGLNPSKPAGSIRWTALRFEYVVLFICSGDGDSGGSVPRAELAGKAVVPSYFGSL